MFESVDPTTGEPIARYEPFDEDEVERRLDRSARTFAGWRRRPTAERAAALHAVAAALVARREPLALLATAEMGKTLRSALAEVDKCAWACRHFADHADAYLADEPVATEARHSAVRYDPLGPILAVMPWNYPYWQVFRHVAPALAAGNTVLLKHAENVTGCALAIEALLQDALPDPGLLQVLLVDRPTVGRVIEDQRIRAVALTGSVGAGRSVGERAGRMLKRTVLELGGSDAFLVLPDADLPRAAKVGAASRLLNNGQSCIAAKRFLVHRQVADEFVGLLAREIEDAAVGDPREATTDVGPMARADLRDQLAAQVHSTVTAGAGLVTGGRAMDRPGWFYEPTLLVDVPDGSAAQREELFGPVASVFVDDDVDALVDRANTSDFGLGASVWTGDDDLAMRMVAELDVGAVFVNELVKSDPRLPFGGVKDSGHGRELGELGIRELTNPKAVWIA